MRYAADLKDDGFLEMRELVDNVAKSLGGYDQDLVRRRLAGQIGRLRAMLVYCDQIVLPEDRKRSCMYSKELHYFFTAYLLWNAFGERRSVVEVVAFYRKFTVRHEDAVRWLPDRLKRQLKKCDDAAPTGKLIQLHA